MRIVVLNGSPKGNMSITLQSVEYLKHHFVDDDFEVFHIGQQIRQYEKSTNLLQRCVDSIEQADLVLFIYPVYTFIAPYQLHRFIELLKAHLGSKGLEGKLATQLTTSLHFYDFTAHRYIEDNCFDMKMAILQGFSAGMEDLLSEKGRQQLHQFWQYVQFSVANHLFEGPKSQWDFPLDGREEKKNVFLCQSGLDEKPSDYDTVIVTDCTSGPEDENLSKMIAEFRGRYPYQTRVINIGEFDFSGGCLGCFSCASHGMCIYKDGFDVFFRREILSADAVIFGASIKDHCLGSRFKLYDDRQFCNGHRTLTMGSPVGYLLSGAYSKEPNLQAILESRCEVGHNFFAGVACDESGSQLEIERSIASLAAKTAYSLEHGFVRPQNFYGVGGMKIFRDLIYVMQGLMKEDHRFYKKHGIYDFPQKQWLKRLKMSAFGLLMSIPTVREKSKGQMNQAILKPYKRAVTALKAKD